MEQRANEKTVADVEVIVLNETDLSPMNERLSRECGPVSWSSQFYWLMLFDDPAKPPLFYPRYFGAENYTAEIRNLIRFNEQVDQPQHVHPLSERLCGRGQVTWRQVEGDPEGLSSDAATWEYGIPDPDYLYRASSRGMRVKEGDLLDLRLRYFPYALKLTENSPLRVPYVLTFGEVEGVLDGKKILGMGGNEIIYRSATSPTELQQMIFIDYAAIREDGRRECAYVMLFGHKGCFGFYWLEGEEPILSQDVTFHGEWKTMPYLDNDTLIPLRLDFRFAGKELHYLAKWGFRGIADPTKEHPGFANTAGVCHEGATPYGHQRCFATAEVHKVLAGTVRPNDF